MLNCTTYKDLNVERKRGVSEDKRKEAHLGLKVRQRDEHRELNTAAP